MATAIGLGKAPQFRKAEVLDLKHDRRFNESWLEQRVADHPEILGLGKVIVLSQQKRQKDGVGRLDLLLESEDKNTVFVVELMLGPVDSSHIVRTIDYWLDSRKTLKANVECRAVLIGERIVDSRFRSVAEFLTRKMPLLVKEVAALQVGNMMTVHFTTVFRSDDLEPRADVLGSFDRTSWLKKSKETVEVAEAVIKMLQRFDDSISANFRQGFIGIRVGNKPVLNFVAFRPFRGKVRFSIRVEDASPWRKRLAKSGLQVLQTDKTDNKVRMAVTKEDVLSNKVMLKQLCNDGYDFWSK